MKQLYLTTALSLAFFGAQAQKTEPLYEAYFSSPENMVQDEDGGYHFATADGFRVSMSDDGYYKLMDNDGNVLEEGDTDEGDNNFVRHGKWTEYYPSGKRKATGSYYQNQPYGHWQLFDTEGNPAAEFDILVINADDGSVAYCKAGTELVYDRSGKLREERFFRAEPYMGEERIQVDDPETDKKVWKKVPVKSYRPKPFGTWITYNPDGTVEKREDKKE